MVSFLVPFRDKKLYKESVFTTWGWCDETTDWMADTHESISQCSGGGTSVVRVPALPGSGATLSQSQTSFLYPLVVEGRGRKQALS